MGRVSEDQPLYATVAQLGGFWSVTFRLRKSLAGHGWMTGSHSGSCESLLDGYRGSGIPLIDFRTVRDGEFPRGVNGVYEACDASGRMDWEAKKYPTLDEYVELMREAGATISYL